MGMRRRKGEGDQSAKKRRKTRRLQRIQEKRKRKTSQIIRIPLDKKDQRQVYASYLRKLDSNSGNRKMFLKFDVPRVGLLYILGEKKRFAELFDENNWVEFKSLPVEGKRGHTGSRFKE